MAPQGGSATRLHFATGELPEQDRLAAWGDYFSRTVLGVAFEPSPDAPFEASVTLQALEGLHISWGFLSASRHERTRELIADGNHDLYLIAVNGSAGTVSHHRRELEFADGDAFLISAGEVYTIALPATARICGLRVPRIALTPLIPDIDDAVVRPLQRGKEALRLLAGYIGLLKQDQAPATLALRQLEAAHVHELLALTIGATRDAAAIVQAGSLRAERLCAIKASVIENLGHGELSTDTVAARHRISSRYVQMLFEAAGTTFSEFVLGERLARARHMLTNPAYSHLLIRTVAFDVGFGDISTFNRAFRRRYGATPSDVRAAAE